MKQLSLVFACWTVMQAVSYGQSNQPKLLADKDTVREAPRVVPINHTTVGRLVADSKLTTVDGKSVTLKSLMGKNGLVIAFTNTSCPICKKYGPSLVKLERALEEKGINILFVNPTSNEKEADINTFRATHQLKGAYVHDRTGSLSQALGATTTAEVFLLDSHRTIIYRGALDDQYGLGYSRDAARQHYLLEAVSSLLKNRPADPAATTAPGCDLDLQATPATTVANTYHNRISRIIQANCVECHRTGGVAPFTLESYDDVVAHAGMIRKVVEKGTMPPWFAVATSGKDLSTWANDRSISNSDKTDLFAWLKSDRPQGDSSDAPMPRTFADGWLIGKPDAVFEFPKPVAIKANGTMPYANITVETKLTEDKWVKAVEVRPSAREVVHHVLVFALPPTDVDKNGENQIPILDESAGYFAIYVPGQSVLSYPDGFAKRLPKGTRLRFQMHYTPNGTATADSTRIGIVYAEQAPQYEVKVVGLANPRMSIPAGADNHPETSVLRVPTNATVLGFLPHMHLRGKAFRYEITKPGGKAETVLDIPHYDFNWQLYYRLAEPLPVTPGTVVKATGWFDNSTRNPANPDANKTVRWGPQTTDEMMLGYLEYFVPVGTASGMRAGLGASGLFNRVDRDGDGKITQAEFDNAIKQLPRFRDKPEEAKKLFQRLDVNKDGVISLEEFGKLGLGQ